MGPRGVYDEAKRFAEALALAYHRCHGIDVRIARIFNTYGPRMRKHDGRVVSNFIVQALQGKNLTVYGDGLQTRSLCYVDDLVEGLIRLLMVDGVAEGSGLKNGSGDVHGPVNLGNPVEMTVMDIAELVLRVTGSSSQIESLPLPLDDPKVRCPDITRAQKLLNWKPGIDPETGIVQTTAYFRSILAE